MYVIRNKKTKAILHVAQSVPGEDRKAEEVYPDFDPRTMEFGKSDDPGIPAWFTIEKGRVKPLDAPEAEEKEAAAAEEPSLDELKAQATAHFSRMSLELRQQLIPEYQVQNAALGLYDEERTRAIRDTVAAFRDEYHRLEAAVEKARSVKELQALKPNFPAALAGARSKPKK